MIYHVRARFRHETATDFLARLTDGSIAEQRPDGAEIVASMERAVVASDGQVEWSETCYCGTPLAHERATVLDLYFDDLTTEEIERHETYDGRPFMNHLRELAAAR